MAVGVLPEPGTKFGPCQPVKGGNGVQLYCAHKDCAQTRKIAGSVCLLCGRAIGYETAYFRDEDNAGRWVHAVCAEDKAECDQKAAKA